MFVVVNETDYHKNVPVLLGTNIHNSIMGGMRKYHGDIYMRTKLHEPWFWTFRCLATREKELVKN